MATTAIPTPAPAPESAQPITPAAPTAPTTAPEATPRQQLYNQYYAAQQPPASETPGEPLAQGEPVEPETPVVADAAPEALPAPEANPLEQKVQLLEQQLGQAVQILQAIAQRSQQAQPQTPAATAPPASTPGDWVELLRQGEVEKAEQVLMNKLSKQAVEQAKQASTQESLELFRVEQEVQSFVNDLRGKNPDLVQAEEFVGYKAQAYLEQAMNSGQIRTMPQYVEAYKHAVNTAVADARKFVQEVRATGVAAGKTEAQTVHKEILSSAPVVGARVQPERGALAKPEVKTPETAVDYIRRRQQDQQRRAGMLT